MIGRALGGLSLCLATNLSASCQSAPAELDFQERALRVAASADVTQSSLQPTQVMGSSGPIADLLYEYPGAHLEAIGGAEKTVRFRAKTGSRHSLSTLASSLRSTELAAVTVEGDVIVAEFHSAMAATDFETNGFLGLGPYVMLDALNDDEISLMAREPGPPRIVIRPAPKRAHWQLLVGGHVDVATELWVVDADEIEQLDSIQLLSIATPRFLGIAFNIEVPLAQRLLLRAAIADVDVSPVACPGDTCKASLPGRGDAPAAGTAAEDRLSPLTITVLENDRESERAFRALALEVWRLTGVRPSLEFASGAEMGELLERGDFQCLLAPFASDPATFYSRFIGPLSKLRYDTDQLKSAVAAADWGAAAAYFDAQAFVIPIWHRRRRIGISTDWCNARPVDESWLWLADLRRCETDAGGP